jgi:hypothetical protein
VKKRDKDLSRFGLCILFKRVTETRFSFSQSLRVEPLKLRKSFFFEELVKHCSVALVYVVRVFVGKVLPAFRLDRLRPTTC